MLRTEDDDVVETLATHAAEKALACGVHERRSDCRLDDTDACAPGDAIEFRPKLGVAVADDELGPLTKGCDLAEPLGSPCLAGFTGDGDMDNRLRVHVYDEEGEKRSKPDIVHLKEIAGPHCVVAEKGTLALSVSRRSNGQDVLLDGALGDPDAELEQLAADTLCAPRAIVTSDGSDQFHRFRRET